MPCMCGDIACLSCGPAQGYDPNPPCEREWVDDKWFCIHDVTSCFYNDGHNECCFDENDSLTPLET